MCGERQYGTRARVFKFFSRLPCTSCVIPGCPNNFSEPQHLHGGEAKVHLAWFPGVKIQLQKPYKVLSADPVPVSEWRRSAGRRVAWSQERWARPGQKRSPQKQESRQGSPWLSSVESGVRPSALPISFSVTAGLQGGVAFHVQLSVLCLRSPGTGMVPSSELCFRILLMTSYASVCFVVVAIIKYLWAGDGWVTYRE